MKLERNPSKQDRDCERLGIDEAYQELFGSHRVVEADRMDEDVPGKDRKAAEFYLMILPFKILYSLMEYTPRNTYWEPLDQLKTLEYWMRTPCLSSRSRSSSRNQLVYERARG